MLVICLDLKVCLFKVLTVKQQKEAHPSFFHVTLNLSSLSLPFSPLGNDLEALQIHLCFCRSNLHPRRAASFGSTLVSVVSNISTSASRRGEANQEAAGDFRRGDSAIGHCLQSSVLCGWSKTDWICRLSELFHQPAHEMRRNSWFQHLLTFLCFITFIFSSVLLTSVSFSLDLFFSSQPFKGFFFFYFYWCGLATHLYLYIHLCIFSIYCMKDSFPTLKETCCTLNEAVVSL